MKSVVSIHFALAENREGIGFGLKVHRWSKHTTAPVQHALYEYGAGTRHTEACRGLS